MYLPTLTLILCLNNLTIAVENLKFFGVWYDAAASNASITKFESSMIIPPPTPDKSVAHNIQAFWPGLEDMGARGVLQPVVTNQGGEPGEWYLLPFYCCNPAGPIGPQMRVYPEDTVRILFALDALTGKWFLNWVVTPGPRGNDAKAKPFGGGLIHDPAIDKNTTGPYGHALLTIELQELGTWNFGNIEWRNIMIEADTTDTEWCLEGPKRVDPNTTFIFTYSAPSVSVIGNSTVCYVAQMTFHQPELGPRGNPEVVVDANTTQHLQRVDGGPGIETWIDSAFARWKLMWE